MKGAPGRSDMRAVNYLFSQGKTLSQVSKILNIKEAGLMKHKPKSKPKSKPKPKPKCKPKMD